MEKEDYNIIKAYVPNGVLFTSSLHDSLNRVYGRLEHIAKRVKKSHGIELVLYEPMREANAAGLDPKKDMDQITENNQWFVLFEADMFFAYLDSGPSVDSGVSVEVGMARALKLPILALRSDKSHLEDGCVISAQMMCAINYKGRLYTVEEEWYQGIENAVIQLHKERF